MTPTERLEAVYAVAASDGAGRAVAEEPNRGRVDLIAGSANRACVRLVMSCMLAKLDNPAVDPRKPYTKIKTPDAFSGRKYDERYLTAFIQRHRLPCNTTTAFLTPVLRNLNQPLSSARPLEGTPPELYAEAVRLLEEVADGRESAVAVLTDVVRALIAGRDRQAARLADLQATLRAEADALPPASGDIVTLLTQHLACRNASRLPVLIVAAAYHAAGPAVGEQCRPLHGHNAADRQTGAAGDLEITLVGDDRVRTVYEIKNKPVRVGDINVAVEKVSQAASRVDAYLFVTTAEIDPAVAAYAAARYSATGGTEFAILDCIGFARHYLHFFHRSRAAFLDA